MILTRVYWMGLLSVLKTLTEKYETLFYYGKNYDTLRKTRESTLAINYRDWCANQTWHRNILQYQIQYTFHNF